MTSNPAPRSCPACGASFTPHPRKPSQTYCSSTCRSRAHRHRERDLVTATARAPSHPPSSSQPDATTSHTDDQHPPGERGARRAQHVANEVDQVQHCPHCRQPISLVTLILTRTAAHVTVPAPPTAYPDVPGHRASAPLITDT